MGAVCTKLLCGGTNILPDGQSPIELNNLPRISPEVAPNEAQQSSQADATTVANQETQAATLTINALGNSPVHAGKGSFFRSLSEAKQEAARGAYKQSLFYHGTSSTSKTNIRTLGFDLQKKTGGATESDFGLGSIERSLEPDSAFVSAGTHHYLTTNKKIGMFFARVAAPENPGLVRVIGTQEQLRLETDPDVDEEPACLRTPDNIPATQVLPSKTDGSSGTSVDAYAAFQSALAQAGIPASIEQAAEVIAEIQTDSGEDFDPNHDFDAGDGYEEVR